MTIHKYTIEQLSEAVRTSTSIRQVCIKLNIAPKGGNNATIKKRICKLNLDTSHFLGSPQKGQRKRLRCPVEHYLNNNKPIGSNRLRKRLLREGILEPQCAHCTLTLWLGQDIPLELDHIDGNPNNNSLTNLRLLCPNCHAMTPTYRGKNKQKVGAQGGTRTRMTEVA